MPEALANNGNGLYAKTNGIANTVKGVFGATKANGSANNHYYYQFTPDIPGWDNPGTFHSVDLWFFFETLAKCWRPFVGRHYDLARQMCNYWANFIKTGDPNGVDADGTPMPEWKPYTNETPACMNFTSEGAVATESEETEYNELIKKSILRIINEG